MRFLEEAEALSRRVPNILYHAGEPALWALVILEAGDCPSHQAEILALRLFKRPDNDLRHFARLLQQVYIYQEEALRAGSDFQMWQTRARTAIDEANTMGDKIISDSPNNEERRREQAEALRDLYHMKSIER